MKLKMMITFFTALVIAVLTFSTPSLAAGAISVDINGLINQSGSILQGLGITPSGTIQENNDFWCTFNNWNDRDNFARSRGTYDNGRWSHGTTFGGKWYCAAKHL